LSPTALPERRAIRAEPRPPANDRITFAVTLADRSAGFGIASGRSVQSSGAPAGEIFQPPGKPGSSETGFSISWPFSARGLRARAPRFPASLGFGKGGNPIVFFA
jgi:hypothetical protein